MTENYVLMTLSIDRFHSPRLRPSPKDKEALGISADGLLHHSCIIVDQSIL